MQGTISAAVGGMVAALTAWAVVTVTHRHEQRTALRSEARSAAVRLFQLVGEYVQVLRRAAKDGQTALPTSGSRDWLIAATGAEITMFSFDPQLGAKISGYIGEFRRALDALHAVGPAHSDVVQAAEEHGQALIDELADWLMDRRHQQA